MILKTSRRNTSKDSLASCPVLRRTSCFSFPFFFDDSGDLSLHSNHDLTSRIVFDSIRVQQDHSWRIHPLVCGESMRLTHTTITPHFPKPKEKSRGVRLRFSKPYSGPSNHLLSMVCDRFTTESLIPPSIVIPQELEIIACVHVGCALSFVIDVLPVWIAQASVPMGACMLSSTTLSSFGAHLKNLS